MLLGKHPDGRYDDWLVSIANPSPGDLAALGIAGQAVLARAPDLRFVSVKVDRQWLTFNVRSRTATGDPAPQEWWDAQAPRLRMLLEEEIVKAKEKLARLT